MPVCLTLDSWCSKIGRDKTISSLGSIPSYLRLLEKLEQVDEWIPYDDVSETKQVAQLIII